jgi:peptidoglycan hydrolase-like protein with peptidoglycan-binding domain
MSREQLSEHESQGAAPAHAEQQGDIQGLPPNLYRQAAQIRPGDVQGLRDLLTLFPDFAPQILAVASSNAGLSTVKQAQALVQQNAVGRGGGLTSQQIHAGGEFAIEGSAPVLGPEPAPQAEAAPLAAAGDAKPLSKPEQREILHDRSDPKPLSKPEQREILHDPSDPKPLNKPELGHILNDPSDPYHAASDNLLAPTQIEDAKGYNAGRADLVATFNHLTTNLCCEVPGASGPVDPQKVATWQAKRNLQVDGKIGPHTIAAAKAAVKNHTEIVAEGQVNPQPTDLPV